MIYDLNFPKNDLKLFNNKRKVRGDFLWEIIKNMDAKKKGFPLIYDWILSNAIDAHI